ncbi:putative HVA22-like protein g [Salvia hispanica]|uniref:putative HVA22-like protein g n=1 Tax=Salvia hispanica TaxID=49212 RepID=UPI002009D0EF|nr:putative HVA22-like protein g [Salvia hispanica]
MIEELITRSLILVFGYAYPAFQCFKTLEKNKVTVPELRFWCQYWVIVALISIVEKVLDIFISWVPFYRAIKLLMYIYLWHPGTKGSTYMYDTVVQPYVSKHEPTIDRGISELKERAWNLALSYWYKSADMSSKKVLECLQLLMAQAMNAALSRPQSQEGKSKPNDGATPTPPSTPSGVLKRNTSEKWRPPVGPAGSVGSPTPNSAKQQKSENDQDFLAARVRLRSVNNKDTK